MRIAMKNPQTLVLLSGLTYVPAAILTPFVTNYQLQKSGVADAQRKLLVKNETVRQAVSAAIHFVTFYGGVLMAGRLFKNKAAQKPVAELLTGILFSTIGHGIIRPILTNGLLVQWMKKDEALPTTLSGPPLVKHPDLAAFIHQTQPQPAATFSARI